MSAASPISPKARKTMAITLIGLLVIIVVASVVFLVLVARLSAEEADLWLRPITGVMLLFTFVVGAAMLITGYVVVDKLGLRVANAQERAAVAERALLELQERTRPHGLTKEQIAALRNKLADTPKGVRFEIVTARHRPPTTELSELYAEQIAEALRESGQEVTLEEAEPGNIPKSGIIIFAPSGFPDANKAALALYGGLQNSEAALHWRVIDRKEAIVRIEIGLTP